MPHDISGLAITLLAILAGILFNRHDVGNLRKDMLERFDRVDKQFTKVDGRFDTIDGRIIELFRAVGKLEGRFETVPVKK